MAETNCKTCGAFRHVCDKCGAVGIVPIGVPLPYGSLDARYPKIVCDLCQKLLIREVFAWFGHPISDALLFESLPVPADPLRGDVHY